MLHVGKGRGAMHKNRKPQGGTPTPAPAPVGNLIKPTTWANFLTAYAAAGSLDVIDISGAWYTPTTPQVFSPTRSIAGSGAILIGNRSQVCQIKLLNVANANTAFIGWNLSGDDTQGNTNEGATTNSGFYAVASSKFGLWSLNVGQGEIGVYLDQACTDFIIQNNNVYFNRDDFLRSDGNTARFLIDGNHLEDNLYRTYYYYFTDGTAPSFATNPGGTSTLVDTNHCDLLQLFSVAGARSDFTISSNYGKNFGQSWWLTAGTVDKFKITGNTTYTGYLYAIGTDTGGSTNGEVSGNTFNAHPDRLPIFGSGIQVDLLTPAAAGPSRGGLNVVTAGGSVINVDSRFNFTAALNGDSVTAPTAPNFSLPSVNVVNLPTITARPTYTPYAGVKVAVGSPNIYGPGGALSSYAQNDWLSVNPPRVKGYTVGGEASYQTRWKVGASIVQAAGAGPNYMVYQATAAGSVTAEVSVDGGTTWVASSAVTVVAAAGSTWNPADKSALVTLSGANLTATANGGSNTYGAVRGTTSKAVGKWYFEINPTYAGAASEIGFGVATGSESLNTYIGNTQSIGVFGNGVIQSANAFLSSITAPASGVGLGVAVDVPNELLYLRNASGWITGSGSQGGDPAGGGAGFSFASLTGPYFIAWNKYAGLTENAVLNTTGAFSYAVPTGYTAWG